MANKFSREGFIFIGWGTYKGDISPLYIDEEEIDESDDLELYAVWVSMENAITITFNANDGTETPETEIQYIKIDTYL